MKSLTRTLNIPGNCKPNHLQFMRVMLSIIFTLLIVGCNRYMRTDVEHDMRESSTPQQEQKVFDRIWQTSHVQFSAHDATGKEVSLTSNDWQKHTYSIRFYQYGTPAIEHMVLDPKNLLILMRE